jgi:serine/threonine protein kinase
MDLKPSNVVLSVEADAVLIDISGIGGVTGQWLSPEMLESKKNPLSWSIATQRQNDIWAIGQVLLVMADACCPNEQE